MSDKTLKALLKLLAFLAVSRRSTNITFEKSIVIAYMRKQFSEITIKQYTSYFESVYKAELEKLEGRHDFDSAIENAIKFLQQEISEQLDYTQRYFILISLIDFYRFLEPGYQSQDEVKQYFYHVKSLFKGFNISEKNFNDCKNFLDFKFHLLSDKDNFMVITNAGSAIPKTINSKILDGLDGNLYLLKLNNDLFLTTYSGKSKIAINSQKVRISSFSLLSPLSVISGVGINSVYFSDISNQFLKAQQFEKIVFEARNAEYLFKKGENGVKAFNIHAETNEYIGILGGSGAGKTTLLNLLSGILPLQKGSIRINGNELSFINASSAKGILGYIPQNDILIDNLTVYENLYYHAALCLGNMEKKELIERVNQQLESLDIYDIKNLIVGSPTKAVISGGQRKRLNIACELIRNPRIIFADEPTSGLSSYDSLRIANLFKNEALKNKIVFVNIHQPSNEIFYLFNRVIILDKGGYSVYVGKPGEALEYFKKATNQVEIVNSNTHSEPEEILSIIENCEVNELGVKTRRRKITPNVWNELFLKNEKYRKKPSSSETIPLSVNQQQVPGGSKQFFNYFQRNFKTKWNDLQFKVLALSISPFIATILAIFCKQMVLREWGDYEYNFSKNTNIPAFYYMSAIAIIFIGLIVSAEDLFRDKKLFIRERFLNLSKLSYLNSKLAFLVMLSFYHSLSFVIVATFILKLSGNLFTIWITLLTLAILSNIIGLLISATLNSLVAIYILIPIILIPQILLGGAVIKYENMPPYLASKEYVPVFSDIMPVRWSYETLIVNQYKHNDYQKGLFKTEQQLVNISIIQAKKIPLLQKILSEINLAAKEEEQHLNSIKLLYKEVDKLKVFYPFSQSEKLTPEKFDYKIKEELYTYLQSLKKALQKQQEDYLREKDHILQLKAEIMGGTEALVRQKNSHYNISIANLVRKSNEHPAYIRNQQELIRMIEPIFLHPTHPFGRSQFYSGQKRLFNYTLNTVFFNNLVILSMALITYILLILIFKPFLSNTKEKL
jgi:ABC-type multidrug transport system ATPase subunit